jgi:signal transduction histidine kinase
VGAAQVCRTSARSTVGRHAAAATIGSRRAALQGVVVVAYLVIGAYGLARPITGRVEDLDVLDVVVGWAFAGSGLYAWHRRPGNGVGVLMVIAGGGTLAAHLLHQFADSRAFVAAVWIGDLWSVIFAAVLLAFPEGRLTGRFDRSVILILLFAAGPLELVWLLFWDPAFAVHNVLVVWPDNTIAGRIDSVQRLAIAGGAVALSIALIRRWIAATPPLRRILVPVLVGAAALCLSAVLTVLDKFDVALPTMRRLLLCAYCSIPLAVIVVAARARLARAGVARLLVTLRSMADPAQLRDPIARALGDPSLELGYWLPRQQTYADADGRPIEVIPVAPGRSTTYVDRHGVRIAALTYDASLDDDPDLVEAVAAAAGIALENGRLHAELRARLEELAESRARVIEAGQAERRRLERNLHDGTQQRLVALAMDLALLERRLGVGTEERARVARARAEIAASLDELRAVARGLYPAVLAVSGLPMALKSLATTSAVPVRLQVEVHSRLPEPVETTAYYVVCESLANIGKHAKASRASVAVMHTGDGLAVVVSDDGVGGADIRRGSGLQGLADRVEALRGRLTVSSRAGCGTRVTASIPCGEDPSATAPE